MSIYTNLPKLFVMLLLMLANASLVLAQDSDEHVAEQAQSNRAPSNSNVYFILQAHKKNYILPLIYTDNFNEQAYQDVPSLSGDEFKDIEAKYQLSVKFPLFNPGFLVDNDSFHFGMTIQSWWQIYADEISKPFRETNYQPEFFYRLPIGWQPFDGNVTLGLGVEHQSNGRSQVISRSWNRIYGEVIYTHGLFKAYFRPWYRLPEDEKESPDDPKGDDNPDIGDYMGHYQLQLQYAVYDVGMEMVIRNNLSTHKGAVELGLSFPLGSGLRGYLQYFTGYGESMIDYDHNQQRIGIGIMLDSDF
ncbi:phospholipase A [Thalassotalea ponticola]|uniref:phospholipase A n=1 Tax=Thalassotalea ponticola TaxID=1523392 RepID=UPI0025B306BE|nr:phospholipase A [Thalassotalea ponticola]MDN3653282.1 phospholipase A [Thalassotalea ponticola]